MKQILVVILILGLLIVASDVIFAAIGWLILLSLAGGITK